MLVSPGPSSKAVAISPWLNVNLHFLKLFFQKPFLNHFLCLSQSIQSSYCRQKELLVLLKLLELKSDFTLTLGYLYPALNKQVLVVEGLLT